MVGARRTCFLPSICCLAAAYCRSGIHAYRFFAQAAKGKANTRQATDYEDPEVWKECFEIFDKDRDGKLNMDELASFIRSLGTNCSRSSLLLSSSSILRCWVLACLLIWFRQAATP
jgi:hypothetical protein